MRTSQRITLAVLGLTALSASITANTGLFMTGNRGDVSVADTAAKDIVAVQQKEQPLYEPSVVDEVIWVVGDEPILKSDVEVMRLQAEMEGVKLNGDPDCAIPEMIAVQKLYLHQAAIDSVEVTGSRAAAELYD